MKPLRPHQANAIADLRRSLMAGKRRPLLVAPTGAGKTMIAASIVDGALRKGNRVLFVVPALSLINQTVNAFAAEGIVEVGVMQGYHELTDWTQPVQVASVQTLRNRQMPDCDIAIIDEAHNWFSFYEGWLATAKYPIVGLTATPWTKGLGKHFDSLIVAATTAELIEQGYLSPFKVFAPSHPDLSGVRTLAGDYHEGDLGAAMDKAPLVADIVETWRRRGENRSTLCFAVNRAHAKHLQRQFEVSGYPTGYIDANTPVEAREAISEAFHDGTIRVVVNVGCLTTGVDWDVRCIILARPTKSKTLYTQIIGRGLRTAEGKDHCIILDHSDTTLRLGFVTDLAIDELDNGNPREAKERAEREEPLPKECPACAFVKPAKVSLCPSCGFKPERQSSIECDDGELVEIKRGKAKPTQAEKQEFYSQLIAIQRGRGYASGWVANQYRKKFEVWPRGLVDVPQQPSPEVLSWVKAQTIRYAKGREKANAQPSYVP